MTARKHTEKLSEVPLALHVISSDELGNRGIEDLQSLALNVPGLYFEAGWGGEGSAPVLRGQAQPSQAGDNVGIFVDGVYQSNSFGVDASMLDLDRIEIVEGPQSALYGHSTFAGAINYVSRVFDSTPRWSVAAEGGDRDTRSFSAAASGPLVTDSVLARLAATARDFGGTGVNLADPQHQLGGYRKDSVSLTLQNRPGEFGLVRLQARYSSAKLNQPASLAVNGSAYNCGSRSASTIYWSYFCGELPTSNAVDLSPNTPDSTDSTAQVALHADHAFGRWTLASLTSYYRGASVAWRDFDGSSAGRLYGVCSVTSGCVPGAVPQVVSGYVNINEFSRDDNESREASQEIRLSWRGSDIDAVVGLFASARRDHSVSDFAAGPLSLGFGSRLTELLPATPAVLGRTSIINNFLSADPGSLQFPRFAEAQYRREAALFGSFDYRLPLEVRAHAELRLSRERLNDKCVLQGCEDPRTSAGFHSVTPRISLDRRWANEGLAWLSAARGERSGGSNDDPTLIPSEQVFRPEENWTYEFGYRGPVIAGLTSLDAVAYYIDWSNTQIQGPSNSPGDHGFITRNISGIYTSGVEIGNHWILTRQLRLDLALALQDPRFRAGSEDVGGIAFCGITPGLSVSSFCNVGPSRNQSLGDGLVVPYIDGNTVMRTPRQQWSTALSYASTLLPNLDFSAHLQLNHQGDVYDRPIDGASYGRRTLLQANAAVVRGAWSASVWALNLTDQRYVRFVSSRGPAFYPYSPRPLDLILGDGRQIGITVQWQH